MSDPTNTQDDINLDSQGTELADPLDRVSDALLSYVRDSMGGVIPKVSIQFNRSPSDLPGTTPEDEWGIGITIRGIGKIDEDGEHLVFSKSFGVEGPTKEVAVARMIDEVVDYLESEVETRSVQLAAAESALHTIRSMPTLSGMWSSSDVPEGEEVAVLPDTFEE